MTKKEPLPVHPLSAEESKRLEEARAKSPERSGWVQIERLRRDAAGKLWISFDRFKQGYHRRLVREGVLEE